MILEEFINIAIKNIINDYRCHIKKYTTEGDVIANLFAQLSHNKFKNLYIHSQVRPFKGNIGNEEVIIDGNWRKQEKANSGCIVDLAILDLQDKYWKKTILKANKDQKIKRNSNEKTLKYWRILSYPVEAFHAAIEVKVRVKNNKSRIIKDIKKLSIIKKTNPKCLTYLIIVDRCTSKKTIKNIQKYAERNRIKFYSNYSLP